MQGVRKLVKLITLSRYGISNIIGPEIIPRNFLRRFLHCDISVTDNFSVDGGESTPSTNADAILKAVSFRSNSYYVFLLYQGFSRNFLLISLRCLYGERY